MQQTQTKIWGIKDWQRHLRDLYEHQNRRRGIDWMWCRMSEEVSEVLRPVRQSHLEVINTQVPDLFAWCCPFADIAGWTNLDQVLWERYAEGCPLCKKFPCSGCGTMPHADELPAAVAKPKVKQQSLFSNSNCPTTVDGWQDYFDVLYGATNKEREPSFFVENMVQDIGKVSKYIRLKQMPKVKAGLCSILAWLFALCNAFSTADPGGKYRLSRLLAAKYDPVCPKCRKNPCNCRGPLASLFISWSCEVSAERDIAEKLLKELNLRPEVFRDFGPDMERGRMFAAFEAINRSDGAIVILASHFSPRVYAELHEALFHLSKNSVLVYFKKGEHVDQETKDLLGELRSGHQVPSFECSDQFKVELQRDLQGLLDE